MTGVGSQQDNLLELASSRTVRFAVVGNVDSGKSTLIGSLSHSTLDDGNGYTRKLISKCKHELETGRTSTISTHMVGFDKDGESMPIPRSHAHYSEAFLGGRASKIASLMDLCGHEKYMRTTVSGLSQGMIDYGLVLVSGSQSPTCMTIYHMNLCFLHRVPVIVVVTKVDSTPPDVLKNTMKRVKDIVRDAGKMSYEVRTHNDIDLVHNKLSSLVPVIKLSCVTGENLKLIKHLMYVLPRRRRHETKKDRPFEYLVEEIFNVQGVGTILSGFVSAGSYTKGGTLYLGPTKSGEYIKTTVKSIHVLQTLVDNVYAGHAACFAVNMTRKERKLLVRHRMVALDKPIAPTKTFVAEIVLTKGTPVTMTKGRFQIQLHILHQRPSCRLVDIETAKGSDVFNEDAEFVLRPGQTARATFQLVHGAHYLRPGMRVTLRDGGVRGVGWILETSS